MAEPPYRGESSTRRQSFRKSLADAALPQEYLDLLEQKRKQLDDSIHKYIAAKERDYKTYEKDLRTQYRQAQGGNGAGSNGEPAGKTRRASSESTGRDTSNSPQIRAQQKSVVDALMATGLSRQQIGQPLAIAVVEEDGSSVLQAKSAAGLVDRRASFERDKEFVGVFTPAFLPALGDEGAIEEEDDVTPTESDRPSLSRPGSAPPMSGASGEGDSTQQDAMQRANSDPLVQAKAKRPVHLQLAHRTSSSGSSADGRLASALKSPTGSRPKRKRVSLAVGDAIVKPSDNVPSSMLNNNQVPSHSRTRSSSSSRRDKTPSIDAQIADGVNGVKETAPESEQSLAATVPPAQTTTTQPAKEEPPPAAPLTIPNASTPSPSIPTPDPPRIKIDPDGDLFDLEEDEDEDFSRPLPPDAASDSDDPIVTGRISEPTDQPPASSSYDQEDSSGAISSSPSSPAADHIEFQPSSSFSRQPLNPGFRRPSANMDPVYRGQDYERAERNVVAEEIYGSRYDRGSGVGGGASFTSGSLGESFMQRNAELMRARAGRGQGEGVKG